jgi:glycosyltransferase involved in cell wall biosynthesis
LKLETKKRCLLFTEYFLPGHAGGGATQTSKNLIERLGDRYDFCVLTGDRESPGAKPYDNVAFGKWVAVIGAKTFYSAVTFSYLFSLPKLVREANPDVVYLNGFFSPRMVLFMLLRRFWLIPKIPVIVAPEDELSEGAMNTKRRKKDIFIFITKLFGLYKQKVVWKASSPREKKEIENIFGKKTNIHIAASATPRMLFENFSIDEKPKKEKGKVIFSFISRITVKKNLHYTIEAMKELKGDVRFDVYGPIEDEIYWREKCETAMNDLPKNIEIVLHGSVPHSEVTQRLSTSHFFVLSTLSESFGHVVLEAMAGGCPVVLSDRTPWLDLETKGLGWDILLDDKKKWKAVLQHCVDMSAEDYERMALRARQYAVAKLDSPEIINANYELFEKAIKSAECGVRSAE